MRTPAALRRLVTGKPVELDGQTLDSDMAMILRLEKMAGLPRVESLPLPAGRAALKQRALLVTGEHPIGESRDLIVPGADGSELPARLYTPRGMHGSRPLLMFIHGGGYSYGDIDMYDGACRYLAERSGIRVLSISYRLAPEHRFPAGLDDCFAAYTWTQEHASTLGIGGSGRIAVGGDSAGGTLATGICRLAREAGVAQPALQVLIYPGTDASQRLPSHQLFGEGFWLTRGFMDRCEALYVDPSVQLTDPRLSPLQARDLSGLASAYVVTAGFDPLRDEGEAYADRLAEHRGEVEKRRHPGLIHGFLNMVGASGSARAAVDEIADRLRRL
ncbi:MAG: alpha/beta hydrolase fold domain-containing protein [Propionibacteriales bacterium]|nr:alpha/beta hydrolase fold domain-containing protein [Propionibacteriales bacterium]